MAESLYVNADWSALVPAGSPEAAFGITPKDAKRRGLVPLEEGETLGEPEALLVSANLVVEPAPEPVLEADVPRETEDAPVDPEPVSEPEAKEAPKPADKAVTKPANKGAARKDPS